MKTHKPGCYREEFIELMASFWFADQALKNQFPTFAQWLDHSYKKYGDITIMQKQ